MMTARGPAPGGAVEVETGRPHTTRVRVLRAAIDLFAERGFEATTMRHLAEAADVKAPALYNHFASKETLLVEAMEWVMRTFMTAVAPDRPATADEPDPEAELEAMVRTHVGRQIAMPSRARAFHRIVNGPVLSSLPPELRRQVRESRRRYLDLVTDLVMLTQAAAPGPDPVPGDGPAGLAGPGTPGTPPRIAALVITGTCEQVHVWYRPEGPLSARQVEDQIWAICRRVVGLY